MPNDQIKGYVNLRDVYVAVAQSLAEANRILDDGDDNISYAVVESEISVAYEHLTRQGEEVHLRLPDEDRTIEKLPTLAFRIKPVPKLAEPVKEPAGNRPTVIPNVGGLKLDEGLRELFGAGLRLGKIVFDPSSAEPAGVIINQKPAALASTAPGTKVDIHVAGESPKAGTPGTPKKPPVVTKPKVPTKVKKPTGSTAKKKRG